MSQRRTFIMSGLRLEARGRWLTACLVCCVAGLASSPPYVLGQAPQRDGPGSPEPLARLGSPFVTPGSPAEGEQLRAQEEARLESPEAVAKREASQTEFENLSAASAAKLAGEAFPVVVDEPVGGPPKLAAGEKVTGFPSANVAQVESGEAKHDLIESLAPMAVETSPRTRSPVDLTLADAGEAFEPKTPVVGLRIPKQLAAGVELGSTGMSLTPVDPQGSPLGGSEGAPDGAVVLYANTQRDADTVIKPTTEGFEEDTMLRSVESPKQLSFRVGLPSGASLVQEAPGVGPVKVVAGGATLASIVAPAAQDAMGTAVPVSMTFANDLVTLTVDDPAGQYTYPIDVDPRVTDEQLAGSSGHPTDWRWLSSPGSKITSEGWEHGGQLTDKVSGYKGAEYGAFAYPLQPGSEARITCFSVESSGTDKGGYLENLLFLVSAAGKIERNKKNYR